ncbi:hypothetical protein FYJ28_07950 [Arthrobacter sp. BL-252-APC-1A]|uniref:hypothetical protein n=1 Tax=Arthrobacter sp. BL-252-APC-1A TaxID=2606622 RepID=UPI0012B3774B|nr:hypothetical protein [Arthrobacter sp. BL-252-APC-1A]MSR98757.1 hypothetical protein [Arthrobacter sp. BL-252-APC-1A]
MSIDIAAFEAVLPDPEVIRAAAAALVSAVGAVVDTAEESSTAWGHLQSPDVYDIAGSEVVFNAFRPVTSSAADLDADIGTVDKAVLAYADTVDALKLRLDAVKADAANFFSRTRGRSQDDWDDDEGLIQAEQNIIGDLNRLYSDLQEAQRVCANAISAIYGGPKYVLTTEEGAGTGEVEFGFSGEQLDAAAVEGNVPWGQPTEWDKPWYRDAWDGVASFGKGVWSGVTGTVTGLGNMVGLGGAEAFEQTWKGLGNLAVNLVIMTTPVVQIALHASGNSDRVQQAGDELLAVGKAAIHWDEWQTDPAYAAGATSFDLASILLTAGAGATAKVGSVAGKIGDVANASGKVSAVVNATGIGKVAGVTVKVTDAAQAFKINAITTVVDTSRVTVGKVGDAWQAADQFVIDSSKSALDSGRAALNSALSKVDTVLANAGHGRFGTPALAGAGGAGPRVVAFTPDTPPARTGAGSGAGSTVPHSTTTPDAPVRTNVPEPSGNGRSSAPDAPVRGNGSGAESPSGKPGHAVPEDRTPSGKTTETSAPAGRVDGDDGRPGGKGDADDVRPGAAAVDDAAGPRNGDADSPASAEGPDAMDAPATKPVVHYDAEGRVEKVDLGDRTHTVSTRNDQIAQLQRSLDPATWKNTDGFLAAHLSPSEFQALDGLRSPDGKLPPHVVETQVADLLEKAFDGEIRGPVRPGASPLENALRGIPTRYYYDLTDAQAIMVHDVRHLLGSGDISQPFQKIMGADDARLVLANEDLYAGSMGGFISQASDTSLLRTVDEIILGLRLDYVLPNNAGMPYRVGETEAVYAVRFHAQKAAPIHIPDYSNHLRVEELRRDRVAEQIREADGTLTPEDIRLTEQDIATYREHANTESGAGTLADRAEWPNTGHGLTSSRVDALPVVPELKVDRGVIMESGAEMWRIDRDGNEVLVGVFNQKTGWMSL